MFEDDPADLTDKMQHIEDHPETAARYRLRAPERIRKAYTWERITDQYEELFLQLANGQDPTKVHSTVTQQCSQEEQHMTAASRMSADS